MEPLPSRPALRSGGSQSIGLYCLDRLPPLGHLLLLGIVIGVISGCSSSSTEPTTSTRVVAVTAASTPAQVPHWCDSTYTASNAPKFALPEVTPARAEIPLPTRNEQRWTWLNLWATWCGPCKSEMPLLGRFGERFRADQVPVDIWYLSVDEDANELNSFLAKQPEFAPGASVKLAKFADLEPWLKNYGMDATASIPIQMLVAPDGGVRCVKIGSIHDGDYQAVKTLISGQ